MYDYIQFTSRIKENKDKGMATEKEIDEAIDWASQLNLLEGYIKEQRAEVKMTLLTEYDEEASIRGWLRDGMIQGAQQQAIKVAKNLHANGASIELIAKSLEMTEEEVREIVNAPVTVKA